MRKSFWCRVAAVDLYQGCIIVSLLFFQLGSCGVLQAKS